MKSFTDQLREDIAKMKKRYRFLRHTLRLGPCTAAFVTVLNELSDLPPHKVGVMHLVWDMNEEAKK